MSKIENFFSLCDDKPEAFGSLREVLRFAAKKTPHGSVNTSQAPILLEEETSSQAETLLSELLDCRNWIESIEAASTFEEAREHWQDAHKDNPSVHAECLARLAACEAIAKARGWLRSTSQQPCFCSCLLFHYSGGLCNAYPKRI